MRTNVITTWLQRLLDFVRYRWEVATGFISKKYSHTRCKFSHTTPCENVGALFYFNIFFFTHWRKPFLLGKLLLLIPCYLIRPRWKLRIYLHLQKLWTWSKKPAVLLEHWLSPYWLKMAGLLADSVCLTLYNLQTSETKWTFSSYSLAPSKESLALL